MAIKEPASLRSDATDLGALWTNAVDDYMKKTGKQMDHLRARSIDDVMKVTEKSMKVFGGFRHDDSKVDKVRSAFSRHLGDMQKAISGIEMVGAAAGAFPPAMPVGIVFAACGHLLSAFAGVKADYDRVEAFFEHSGRFFERLSILENQADAGPLAVAIVRVFSAQLSICGMVEAMTKGTRFKQWLNALWNLEDQDLAAAYAAMQDSIEELGQTVGYASYSAIRATQDSVERVNDIVNNLDKNIQLFRSSLTEDVQALYASNLNLEVRISEGFISMEAKQDESHAMQMLLAQQQARILRAVENKYKGDADQDKRRQGRATKGDVGDSRVQALGRIKAFFEDHKDLFPGFQEVLAATHAQDQMIKQSFIDGTNAWIADEPHLGSWQEGMAPLLWIRGSDGVGKSFTAHSIIQKLRSSGPDYSNSAYFYFRSDVACLQTMETAFGCIAVQLAESNSRYAELVATHLKRDAGKPVGIPTWNRFFTSIYTKDSHSMGHLYLVLDGLDEMEEKQRQALMEFLRAIRAEKAKVSVLITSRPEADILVGQEPVIIDVTKEKISNDLRALVRLRLATLPRLRKFRPWLKKLVLRKVVKHADCMLYVEHMLRRLSDFGREDLVIKALGKMPATLRDLYKVLLDECGRDRTDSQFATLKTLFAWLAFSKNQLKLGDAMDIVMFACPESEDGIDLEGEIIGRSSRILELQVDRFDEEDEEDDDLMFTGDNLNDESGDDETSDIAAMERNTTTILSPLTFQERSLRQYFREVDVTLEDKNLRTRPCDAHVLILTMCADMVKKSSGDSADYRQQQQLIDSWYDHFMELSTDDLPDEVAGKVLQALRCILDRSMTHPFLFQNRKLFAKRSPDTMTWYDKVVECAQKGVSSPDGTLSAELREWASGITAEDIIYEIARGHFTVWVDADRMFPIMTGWWYLKPAFDLYQNLKSADEYDSSMDPKKKILLVADTFEPGEKSANTLKAIAVAMSQANFDKIDTFYYGFFDTEARSYLEKSIALMKGNSKERINALSLLISLCGPDDSETQMSYIDEILAMCKALESEEMTDMERFELNETRLDMEAEKGGRLKRAGKLEEALALYEAMMRSTDGRAPYDAYVDITQIATEMDPSVAKFAEMFRSWSDEQRDQWFMYLCAYHLRVENIRTMTKMAKIPGQTEFMLEWLASMEKKLVTDRWRADEGLQLLNIRSMLAHLYFNVVGDAEKAKKIRSSILTDKLKTNQYDVDRFKEALTEEWMRLADMIFSQFSATSDPQRKEELLKELKSMPRAHTHDELKDSHVGMLLANMLRVMGPSREYHRYMEEIFATCIGGLEDSVSFNDGPSLRLLAKILSSLDGLERDAQIAYSAQFSMLDRDVYEEEWRRNSETGETDEAPQEDAEESQVEGGEGDSPTMHTQDKSNEEPPLQADDSKLQASEEKGNQEGRAASSGSGGQNDSIDDSPAPDPQQDDKPWMRTEDCSDYWIFCNSCRTSQMRWERSLYLCLICPSVDICEKCFDAEVTQRRLGKGEEGRLYVCDENHRYLKGCMKGWQGIKDGVIRIGDEELAVKEWIRELKEVRWKKAWERFWLTQGGLKDIDED